MFLLYATLEATEGVKNYVPKGFFRRVRGAHSLKDGSPPFQTAYDISKDALVASLPTKRRLV
jgi:hypothetical protein